METVILEQDIAASPLIGYRMFAVHAERLALSAIARTSFTWEPGPQRFKCNHVNEAHQHEINIATNCGCGFWATRSRKLMEQIYPPHQFGSRQISLGRFSRPARMLVVTAQIEMWGKVIEHKDGYRSEWARIIPQTIQAYPRNARLIPVNRKIIEFLRKKYTV